MNENRLLAIPDAFTGRPEIPFPDSKGRFPICPILTLVVGLSMASEVIAQSPPYQVIHEGKHWTWYARQDQSR
jgi:hypothetical protein